LEILFKFDAERKFAGSVTCEVSVFKISLNRLTISFKKVTGFIALTGLNWHSIYIFTITVVPASNKIEQIK